ncbi:MAG: OmpA family protein [Alphaproteobacteria bacterium]|nr:OmpA family protein [Alphaproteobacteria bacterium]
MAANDQPAIIIRKKRKKAGGGHHGGAWKVAYADFVTAMMAFFLLLWLLNVTTDIERKGIADYFAPASISKSESGAGGVMGGLTITMDGAMQHMNSPPTVEERTIPTTGKGEHGEDETPRKSDGGAEGKADGTGAAAGAAGGDGEAGGKTPEQAIAAAIAKREAEEAALFGQATEALRDAIRQSPELSDLAEQLVIDNTPEGLRIQIVDKDNYSMFPSGGANPYQKSRDLLHLVGKVLARLPNRISVSGHTDGKPFPVASRRDNWSLSTERANVSRAALVNAGVANERVARVVGMADRDPLDPANPLASMNRRISIVLLRQNLNVTDSGALKKDKSPAPGLDVAPSIIPQ